MLKGLVAWSSPLATPQLLNLAHGYSHPQTRSNLTMHTATPTCPLAGSMAPTSYCTGSRDYTNYGREHLQGRADDQDPPAWSGTPATARTTACTARCAGCLSEVCSESLVVPMACMHGLGEANKGCVQQVACCEH